MMRVPCFAAVRLSVFLVICLARVSPGSAGLASKTVHNGGDKTEDISTAFLEATNAVNEGGSQQSETASGRELELQHTAPLPTSEAVRNASRRPRLDSSTPDVHLTDGGPLKSLPSTQPLRARRSLWRRGLSSAAQYCSCLKAKITRAKETIRSNRFVLLACYLFYSLLATGCLFGWPSTSRIVALQEGFSDACGSPTANVTDASLRLQYDDYLCEEQKVKIEQHYRTVRLISGLVAGVAGLLFNELGPRLTAVIGQTLNIVSWSLLAASNSSFRSHSYALMLLGGAVAFNVFPLIALRNIFPEKPHFVLTVLGTAVSYSGVTPRIITFLQKKSGMSNRAIIIGYIFSALVPSYLIAIFLMPSSSSSHTRHGAEVHEAAEGFDVDEAGDFSLEALAQGLQSTIPADTATAPHEEAGKPQITRRRRARPRPPSGRSSRSIRRRLRNSKIFRVLSQLWSLHFALVTWYLLAGYLAAEFFEDTSPEGTPCHETTLNLTEHLATFFWCVIQGNAVTPRDVVRTMVCVSIFGWLMYFIPLVASGPDAAAAARDFYLLFRPFYRWHSFTAIEKAFGTSASPSLAGFATMASEVLHYLVRDFTDTFVRTSSQKTILRGTFLAVHTLQLLSLYVLKRIGRRRTVEDVDDADDRISPPGEPEYSIETGQGRTRSSFPSSDATSDA